MNGTVKGLIAGAAVLALLGGGFAALKLTEGDDNNSSSASDSTAETEYTLCSQDVNNLASVDVENESGKYSIIRTYKGGNDVETVVTDASGVESTTTVKDSSKYAIRNLEDYGLDEALFPVMTEDLAGLTANELISENAEDMAVYGLEKPVAKVTLNFDDKTELKLLLGGESLAGDIYVAIEGESKVYTVSPAKIKDFREDEKHFLSKLVLAKPGTDEASTVKSLSIKRENLDYEFLMEYDETLWMFSAEQSGGSLATLTISKPAPAFLDLNKSTQVTDGMFGLTADTVYATNATESDVKAAGLDEPFCTVKMTAMNGLSYTLIISEYTFKAVVRKLYLSH